MGTILNVSAQRMKGMKRKWFDFNLILKSYVVKKLLKSHVKNKLKNKEKIFFFLNVFLFLFLLFFFSSSFLLFTGNLHCQLPLLFIFSGRLQQSFWLRFAPTFSHFVLCQYQGWILHSLLLIALYTAILLF